MFEGSVKTARTAVPTAALLGVALFLGGCGGTLLPAQDDHANGKFKTFDDVKAAYARVQPGQTRVADLSGIGFDLTEPNVEQLSYLGVMERFMPRANMTQDEVAPEVRKCIHSRDHCMAYVFRPSMVHTERKGDTMLDVFGFDRTTINHGWSAEVTILVQDDRVAYKVISSKPNINETHEKVQPLGPLQDLGNAVVPAAEHL
jgi:hypothetical protein